MLLPVIQPWGPTNSDWTATGPTRWDYEGATRLIYDNTREPLVKGGPQGAGKVCVTWLEPQRARVQKLGGTNAVSVTNPKLNGSPGINPWNGWHSESAWIGESSLAKRAYVGLYTVSVSPDVVSLDTRFLMACDVMAANDVPHAVEAVPCDPSSMAARCGSTVVVFGRDGDRSAGWVDVPDGVALVVVVNIPEGPRVLAASAGRLEFA